MSHSQQQSASFGRRPHSFVTAPAGQPPRKEHAALKIAVGVVCACLVVGLGAAVGGDGSSGRKPGVKLAPTVTGGPTASDIPLSREELRR